MAEKRFRVVWTDQAVRDLSSILDWVLQESPAAARRLLHRIRNRAAVLHSLPARGRVVPELARIGQVEWRELIISPHRLVYRVVDRKVHVLAVLDGRRDIEDLLLERLTRTP